MLALDHTMRLVLLATILALGCSRSAPEPAGDHAGQASTDCELRSISTCESTIGCELAERDGAMACTSASPCQQIVEFGECRQTQGCEWLGDESRGLCESAVVPCAELATEDCELAGCELEGSSCRAKDSQVPLAAGPGADSSAS